MNKLRENKGSTLLELLIGLTIVSVVLLVFFKVINGTSRINTKNDRDIKSLNILQTEIENLRGQIKSKENKENEISLIVYDDSLSSEDKAKEIIFIDDKADVNYRRVDKYTGNEYKIKLSIEKELVQANKNKIETALFNDYKYIIDIESELEKKYFSKKKTKISDVKILSTGLHNEVDDEGEGEEEGGGSEDIKPSPLSDYNVRIHTIDDWNLDVANEAFNVASNSTISNYNDRALGQANMDFKNSKFIIRYMPKGELPNDPFMQLEVIDKNNNSKYYTVKEYGFDYSEYNYISFYLEHTGMQLNNVVVNGESFGNINKDVKKPINKSEKGITIEFEGGTKIKDVDPSGPNSHIRSDIYMTFSN